jgi:hypothetical protein
MSPERLAGPAYRAIGGEVVSRAGRALRSPALALLAFYGREALARRAAKDAAAARHCAWMAVDLARALLAAEDWRRAAGVGEQPLAPAGKSSLAT